VVYNLYSGRYFVKIDLHTHTRFGSACAYMEPDQLVIQAKAMGLDGVCVTEHDQVWGEDTVNWLRRRHDFLVIGGVEVSTDFGHVLAFGLHQPVRDVVRAEDLRRMVDEAGGIMILAHPFRYDHQLVASYFQAEESPEKRREILYDTCRSPIFQLVDALELYNGQSGFDEVTFTDLVAGLTNLPRTGGSDAHAILGVGACYTFFDGVVRDERDLIAQIKAGSFRGVDQRWPDNNHRKSLEAM